MMRNLILTVAALTALTLGPAFAQTYELDITAQLRAQGYQNITLSHTWLGRTRIVALLGSDLREIVLDPNTGEILRDLSRTVMAEGGSDGGNGGDAATVASAAPANGGNSGTVRTTSGAAAATALDGQVTTSVTVGITGASGGGMVSPATGTGNMVSTGTTGEIGQAGTPFQILGPTGGQ